IFTSSQGGGLVGPKQKQPKWKQSKGSSSPSPGVPTTPSTAAAPEPADYLDSYMRAQLKALLSQVSLGLTLRLRKANTKEVGVQVNPRVDASVQCSMGQAGPAICSPGLNRHLFTLPEAARPQVVPPTAPERKEGADGEQVALQPEEEPGERSQRADTTPAQQSQPEEEKGAAAGTRSAFQFLEQKYGYFHCKDCKTRWESAYVWCISGSNKVYFKQLCRKCQKDFNPYRVEAIQCQTCSKTRCSCPQKKRHIDLKRSHRQELCGRCKGKRLFCDNTYSFKYIV
uniref:3CxxC-type domain-containing protein n=1 Tax=Terrapene triunguis TaxID=2587831 RepID=A0A674IRN8_9SAUR